MYVTLFSPSVESSHVVTIAESYKERKVTRNGRTAYAIESEQPRLYITL